MTSQLGSVFLLLLVLCGCNNLSDTKINIGNESIVQKEKSSQIHITISIKKNIGKRSLIIYEPINNNTNFEYYPKDKEIKITNDTVITYVGKTNQPNTYVIRYAAERAILYLFPSDSISISFEENKNGIKNRFSGDDSLFHTKYNEDAYRIFRDKGFDTIFPKKPETPTTLIAKVERYIAHKTKFLDSLYTTGKIITSKYNFYKKMYAYSMAAISTNPISMYYPANGSANIGLFNALYKTYPPFDTIGLKCFYNGYLSKYLYDVDKKRTTVYSGIYDSTWKNFSYYSDYGYAPDYIQENIWGHMLIILSKKNTGEIDIKKAFEKYSAKFPISPYNPIIRELQSKPVTVFSGKFIDGQMSSIASLWETNFKNRAVFIDLWATWCSPCIEEFEFKDQLHDFLKTKDVQMLYLSMDDLKSKTNWRNLVKRLTLNGYNHIANAALKNDIIHKIYNNSNEWTIPRYFLINKKGIIVLKDALRPSDKDNLYDQIKNALK